MAEGNSEQSTGMPKVKCRYCEKTYSFPKTRKAHERRFHGSELGLLVEKKKTVIREEQQSTGLPKVKCRYCEKTYALPKTRKVHELKVHGSELSLEKKKTVIREEQCLICHKFFTSISGRNKHIRNFHKDEVKEGINVKTKKTGGGKAKTSRPNIKCSDCGDKGTPISFQTLNMYRYHLEKIHQTETQRVQYEFSSMEECLTWKDGLEMDVGVNYTVHHGSKKVGKNKKRIFYCRRSGVFKPSVEDCKRKRASKRQGSSKLGVFCTSSIEVIEREAGVFVTFYPDHRGHDLHFKSLAHMNIPKSEKDRIAGMMLQGINHTKILKHIQEESSETRTAFIKKQDLRNIAVKYGVDEDKHCHSDDSRSVSIIAGDYESSGELPKSPTKEVDMILEIFNEDVIIPQPQNYLEKIMKSLSQLQVQVPSIGKEKNLEGLKALDSILTKAINVVNAMKSNNTNELPVDSATIEGPGNKKCVKQDRLYSTKKSKRKEDKSTFKKPMPKQSRKLANLC